VIVKAGDADSKKCPFQCLLKKSEGKKRLPSRLETKEGNLLIEEKSRRRAVIDAIKVKRKKEGGSRTEDHLSRRWVSAHL